MIEAQQIRIDSLRRISELGLMPPEHLPLNEDLLLKKTAEATAQRLAVLNAVVSVCFGCPLWIARNWLSNNDLDDLLTEKEQTFIYGAEPTSADIERFELSIEAVWALLWALNRVSVLDPKSYCGDNLKELAPKVGDENRSAKMFVSASCFRSEVQIVREADFLYCLDWFARKAELKGESVGLPVRAYVIRKRRHALSWLFSRESDWDEVPTDT